MDELANEASIYICITLGHRNHYDVCVKEQYFVKTFNEKTIPVLNRCSRLWPSWTLPISSH